MKKAVLRASEIIDLLAARHTDDVFIPECKGGPTWGGEHCRLDAWAMRKSWSRPLVWGYEVKVSRSDFVNDNKWRAYLDYCNDFYFACPPGVIKPEELPAEAGLLWVASTGRCLFVKKKAPSREVSIPEDIWRYILMNRVKITRERYETPSREHRIAAWKERMGANDEGRLIGYYIRRETAKRIEAVELENANLKQENEALNLFKTRLHELGVNANDRVHDWNVRQVMRELRGEVPMEFVSAVDVIERHLPKIRQLISGNCQS